MAEFGPQATELSAPQGAGATVINPVTASPLDNGVASNVSNFLNIFAKGMELDKKAKAEAANQEVIGRFAREQQAINEDQGLAPDAIVRRSRALANKYLGAYPSLTKELKEIASGFSQFSQLGEAVDVVKNEEQMRKELLTKIQADGLDINPNQPKNVQDAVIRQWQTVKQAEAEFKRQEERKQAAREAGRYDAEVEKRQSAIDARINLNRIAEANLDSVFTRAENLRIETAGDPKALQQANLKFAKEFADIDRQINAIAGGNPELATMYRGIFQEAHNAIKLTLDPATDAKAYKDAFDAAMYKNKMLAVSDPKVAAAVTTSQLFGNAPGLATQLAATVVDLPQKLESLIRGESPGTIVPSVTGTTADKPVLDLLRESTQKYNSGSAKDSPQTQREIINTTKGYLKQLGRLQNEQGLTPQQLQAAVDYFSSADYGKFAAENPLNAAEIRPAMNVFEMYYEKQVVELVNKTLDTTVITNTGLVPNRALTGGKIEPKTESVKPEEISVEFDGTGVKIYTKSDGRATQAATKELNQAAAALNKMIRLGANLSGRPAKDVWEEKKYEYLPRMFPIKPGTVINGYKYNGGNPKDESSYTKVGGNNE